MSDHECDRIDLKYGVPFETPAIQLDPISDKNSWDTRTEYFIMLKTLQQARMEKIWQPYGAYLYKWADQLYAEPVTYKRRLRSSLDVGIMKVPRKNTVKNDRHRYILSIIVFQVDVDRRLYPSEKVREVDPRTVFASLGFPGTGPAAINSSKSEAELKSVSTERCCSKSN